MQLIRNVPTERLTFEDGNWVDLKARLTMDDRQALAGGAVTMVIGDDGKAKPTVDIGGAAMAALRVGIVAWSLPDDLTPANIALLDDETGMAIKKKLDELWKTRPDDERKNSNGGGAPPSEAKEVSRPSSDGSQ